MACLNFEYSLIGQVFLDEAGYAASRSRPGAAPRRRPPSSSAYHYPLPHPQHHSSLSTHSSSFLSPYSAFFSDLTYQSHATSWLQDASFTDRALYPIYEDEGEGNDDYDNNDDDDDDIKGAFDAPFLRFFKSCFVQFVYMIPTEKAVKSPPTSPR